MQWASWTEFWSMGGDGPFVWGSYGLTLVLVVLEVALVLRGRKETLRRLLRWRRAVGKDVADKDKGGLGVPAVESGR